MAVQQSRGWLSALRQRQFSPLVSLVVVALIVGIGFLFVPQPQTEATKRIARIHETVLLNAEMGYYQKHNAFVLGTDGELKALITPGNVDPTICTRGGHHSVIKYENEGKHGIVYHCSLNPGNGKIWVPTL